MKFLDRPMIGLAKENGFYVLFKNVYHFTTFNFKPLKYGTR